MSSTIAPTLYNPRSERSLIEMRWGQMKNERASWMGHWREISDFTLPRSGRFFLQDRNRGEKRYNMIYDNTATRALRVLGAGLMGGATSPARPWFRYGVSDPELARRPEVKEWLSTITHMALDILQKSNTYRTLQGTYEELGAFGTAASFMMDDFDKVICHYPKTIGEYAIAQNYRGEVDTLYSEFEKPVASVVREFGYANCTNTVKAMYDRGQLDSWVPILHVVEPRGDRDLSKADAKNMAWKSCYYERGSDNDKALREGGMKQFRALCPRWQITGGDIYGNSPGMECLGDTKQLQHEQLRKAEGIDYMTKPPLQIPTALKNADVSRFPGGNTFIDSPAGNGIKPMFETNLRLDYLLEDIKDVRQRIQSAYYTDLFLLLSNNNSEVQMTATEVAELHEEKLLMLGPVLERLHNELFSPLIDNVFQRMLRAGLLPPPPPALSGAELTLEFVSMLAQAQRAVETNSVDRYVTSMGQLIELGITSVADKFDADKWADRYSDQLGIDPELIVGDDKVAMIRKTRQQQQQQQVAAAQAEQASKTAKNLGQAPTTGGNALTDVTNAFSGYSTPQSQQGQ